MSRRPRLFPAVVLAASTTVAAASPGDAGELGIEDVDPIDLEIMIMHGEVDEAIEEAQRMLAGLRPSDEPLVLYRIGQVLTRLCQARSELGQFAQAEASCLEAVATLDEIVAPGGLENMAKAEAQAMLAYTYERMPRYHSAITARRRQLELTDDGPRTADFRSSLLARIGDLQLAVGARQEAELSYREAVDLITEVPEKKRREALSAYRSLAGFYLVEERVADAESILKTGLAEAEKLPGEWDWLAIHFSEALGWIYFFQGRYDEAREKANAALDYYRQKGYDRFLNAAQAHILLARIETAESPGSQEAARLLTAVLEMPDEEGSPVQSMKALANVALAEHHLVTGHYAEAEAAAREGVAVIGEGTVDLAIAAGPAYRLIALALQGQGRYAEAAELARQAYATAQQLYPPHHSETGETLALLADLYKTLGEREEQAATQTLLDLHRAERAKFESGR